MTAEERTCPYGDPTCPCQDGDMCHYEGDNPMNVPPEFVRTALSQAEAAAVAREREAWKHWLNETYAAVAEKPCEPDTAITCGGDPSPTDYMLMGFMTALLHWKAAIRAREG